MKEFTEEELTKAAEFLGSFDIVFSSYSPDPTPYLLMKVVHDKYGTKFVLDADDDLFHVNPDNPFWTKTDHQHVWYMQNVVKDAAWVTTTTERLANTFRERREQAADTVTVLPNLMSDEYQHPPLDNGEWTVIGYFGGASHFYDLNDTGCMKAIERLMHKYKKVRFKVLNMPVAHYIPVKRYDYMDGKRGTPWITEIFPTLNMDISIIPVIDNIFNYSKSNIKWMESTRAGAATVSSDIGPYHDLPDGVTIKVKNTEDEWYVALEKLVTDIQYRKQMVARATDELNKWRLEDKWVLYKDFFEKVYNS